MMLTGTKIWVIEESTTSSLLVVGLAWSLAPINICSLCFGYLKIRS